MLAEQLQREINNGDVVTYEEYKEIAKTWQGKVEYIDGKIYMLAGEVNLHGIIKNDITFLLRNKLKGKECKAVTEFSWYYKNESGKEIPIQPDVAIVCDWRDYKDKYSGQIKFVIEVLSENTRKIDSGVKLKKYKELGVVEYILVDIDKKSIEIFDLSIENPFSQTRYLELDKEYVYKSKVYDIEIGLSEIFEGIE